MVRIAALLLIVTACGGTPPPPKAAPRTEKNQDEPAVTAPAGPRRLVVTLDKYEPIDANLKQAPRATFKKLSSKPNQITDDENWFDDNGFELPNRPRPGVGVPDDVDGVPLRASFASLPIIHLFENGTQSFLGVEGEQGGIATLYDVTALRAPTPGSPEQTAVAILDARVQNGALYVCAAHSTYAKATGGQNAFVTAITAANGVPRWRSAPLVCNAQSFVLTGPLLVTGYGFTQEPDFLYALAIDTGLVVGKTKLDSGPEFILEKQGELYVRTYDHDYRFSVSVK